MQAKARIASICALALCICASAAQANPILVFSGPFGFVHREAVLFSFWIYLPSVLIEGAILQLILRPPGRLRFFLLVIGVHLISCPMTVVFAAFIGQLAEVVPIALEYILFSTLLGRARIQAWIGKGIPADRLLVATLVANLATFALGNFVIFNYGPDHFPPLQRPRASMRYLGSMIEAYGVDHGEFPPSMLELRGSNDYPSMVFTDLLAPRDETGEYGEMKFAVFGRPGDAAGGYIIWSVGPNATLDVTPDQVKNGIAGPAEQAKAFLGSVEPMFGHDPTNGALSAGDLFWTSEHRDPEP